MSLKEKLDTNLKYVRRWLRIGDRWTRRAAFWKWLYNHNLFKEKAKTMNKQCVEEASAFYNASFELVRLNLELLRKAKYTEEES